MILGLRRKVSIKVRQPLARIMVPVPDKYFREKFEAVKDLILAEVNVKEVEYIDDTASILVKKIKPNFKTLGPRYGKLMKEISNAIAALTPQEIALLKTVEIIMLQLTDSRLFLQLKMLKSFRKISLDGRLPMTAS